MRPALGIWLRHVPRMFEGGLRPVAAVQRAVLDSFGDMWRLYPLAAFQVSDGTANLQDPVMSSRAQTEAGHCSFEHALAFRRDVAEFADLPRTHLGVAIDLFAGVPPQLTLTAHDHALAKRSIAT